MYVNIWRCHTAFSLAMYIVYVMQSPRARALKRGRSRGASAFPRAVVTAMAGGDGGDDAVTDVQEDCFLKALIFL